MKPAGFVWINENRIPISGMDWPVKDPRAVICLMHGMGEHMNRYQNLVDYFNAHQIAVIATDHQGHGLSQGKRGHVSNYETLLNETEHLLEEAAKRYPECPRILYGHSMGGNIVLNYVLKRKPAIAGLIATSPWITLAEAPPAILLKIARLIHFVYPKFSQPSNLNANFISTLPEEVSNYQNDPLVHDQITTATLFGVMEAAEWLQQFKGAVPVPTLITHGSADQIVSPAGSRNLIKQLTGPVQYKEWEGMYHEVHHDRVEKAFFTYIHDWIKTLELF